MTLSDQTTSSATAVAGIAQVWIFAAIKIYHSPYTLQVRQQADRPRDQGAAGPHDRQGREVGSALNRLRLPLSSMLPQGDAKIHFR